MSVFQEIEEFVADLFKSADKIYDKLDPVVKADINVGINFVKVVEDNLNNPGSDLAQLGEAALGSFAMDKIKGVAVEVATDLGYIAAGAAQPTAEQAFSITLDNLKTKSGQSLKDALFAYAKAVANKLSGGKLPNFVGNIVVQLAFNKLFPATA